MKSRVSLLLFHLLLSSQVFAASSWFTPSDGTEEARSVYWRPALSFLLAGFDQYLEGHIGSGLIYSSIWLGAGAWQINRFDKLDDTRDSMLWVRWSDEQKNDYITHEELPRQVALASQYTLAVGALSAWHSFRTSVETQKPLGRYDFLRQEETPMDLLAAPFHFSYLTRPTSWIPLLAAAALGAARPNALAEDYQRDPFSRSDAAYASAFSYNAGVSEEALFRGYLQPLFYESWRSPLWANSAQALIFGLAHLGSIDRPVAQLGMGYYLGWLQQERNWTLGEGVFLHAWWDVIALSSSYLVRLKPDKRQPPPIIWLPTFTLPL